MTVRPFTCCVPPVVIAILDDHESGLLFSHYVALDSFIMLMLWNRRRQQTKLFSL